MGAPRQRMAPGQHRHPGIASQRTGLALGRRIEHHADIHQARAEQGFHFVIADFQGDHLDAGVKPVELAQQRRQKSRQHHGETGQANRPAFNAFGGLDGAANGLQRGEHGPRLLDDRQADGGRQRLAILPAEQLHAQGFLDQGQGLTGARLGHSDPLGGAGDVAGVRHGHHHSPVHQVHHGSSFPYGSFLKD
ncbi:hypothetical protein D3C84_660980 [compost metagenome]